MRHQSYYIWLTHLNCTVQWFLAVYSQSCAVITIINFRNFHHSREKPCTLCSHSSSSQWFYQPQATAHLLSVFMDLPLLGISHKWKQTLRGHLCLASFAQHHIFKVHPCCIASISTSFLFMAEYFILWILIFYLSICQLGHPLFVSDNNVMNMCVQVFVWTYTSALFST